MVESPLPRADSESLRTQHAITVVLATVFACAVMVAVSGDAWRFPYQYGDDLILDVPTWSYRDEKLPGEARWIVWLWHELFGGQSPATDFRWSLLAWSASMALIAPRLTTGARWPSIVCAIALSANPAVLGLLSWPHTALPMMATMLTGAALLHSCHATTRRIAVALAVATCAAMLAFQLFALLLIAAALLIVTARALRARQWNAGALLRDATTVVSAGVAGTIAGLLLSYALNEAAFGHFGLHIADWRQSGVTSDSRAALAVMNVRDVLLAASRNSGHVLWPLLLLSLGTWSVMAVRTRGNTPVVRSTMYVVLVILLGVMLAPSSVALLAGAPAPAGRGGLTVWFAAITAIVLLADQLTARRQVAAFGTMAMFAAAAMWLTGDEVASGSRLRQSHDVHLARIERDVRAALRDGAPARILIAVGAPHPFDSLSANDDWWVRALLRSRLEPALARSVIYCASMTCEALKAQSFPDTVNVLPAYPDSGYVHRLDDVLLIRFSAAGPNP